MSEAKIDAFFDCVSPYSYYAALHLLKSRKALLSHGVDFEFHPVFLGGINAGSGNKPPWMLPAKGKYSQYETARAKKHFGVPELRVPSFFPIVSLLPQRALVFIKARHPREKYENVFLSLWHHMWIQGEDMSNSELLAKALSENFSETEVKEILEATGKPEWKDKLTENTKRALDYGAFGAPWFWVRNKEGQEEPFFGSDRFHYIWEFLGLPWTDIKLHEKKSAKL